MADEDEEWWIEAGIPKEDVDFVAEYIRTKARQPPMPSPAIQEFLLWKTEKEAGREVGPEPVVPPEEWERLWREREAYYAQQEDDAPET